MYYNVHTYQQSILSEMGTLIAAANAKANLGGVNVAPQKVVDHLKAAVKVRARCRRCWWLSYVLAEKSRTNKLRCSSCVRAFRTSSTGGVLRFTTCPGVVAVSTDALCAVIPMISSSFRNKETAPPLV